MYIYNHVSYALNSKKGKTTTKDQAQNTFLNGYIHILMIIGIYK